MVRNQRYAIVGATSALLLMATGVLAVTQPDPRIGMCGGADGLNEHRAAFEIPSAANLWTFLPAMGRTPELEHDSSPAFVVVFGDGYTPRNVSGHGQRPTKLDGVVCVVQSDGQTNVYFDVVLDGLQIPNSK